MQPSKKDVLSAFARDVHEELEHSRDEVAELFFYKYIQDADSAEDAIKCIAELISYGDDPYKIWQMMALGE